MFGSILAEILINNWGGTVNDENWHADNSDDGDEAIKNIPERATFDTERSKGSWLCWASQGIFKFQKITQTKSSCKIQDQMFQKMFQSVFDYWLEAISQNQVRTLFHLKATRPKCLDYVWCGFVWSLLWLGW